MSKPPRFTAHVVRELPVDLDPPAVFECLRQHPMPWLLESAHRSAAIGRYSFVGADPYLVLRARGDAIELDCRRQVRDDLAIGVRTERGPALDALRRYLPASPDASHDGGSPPPFRGGAVGYLGYELAGQLDVHRFGGRDDLELPDAIWLFVDALVAFDHERDRAEIHGLGFADDGPTARRRAESAVEELARRLREPPAKLRRAHPAAEALGPCADLELAGYLKAIDTAKEQIAAGEIYQACLTYRLDRPFGGDPWDLYRALRRCDPAPFASFLELPELTIASASPERFLKLDSAGLVESRPIKGTAPRDLDPEGDERNRQQLVGSEKERAENLMIVDLVRNDLGRVCAVGSVHVPELMAIEPYSAVFQMVSTVRGRLRADRDALDAVAASFPPGSMTGAPKIAAMRLLDRLESVRRAVYSGAIGYLDVCGGADLAVVIRTAFLQGGRAVLHAGGGIVADSDPVAEYYETRAKLRPLLAALEECASAGGDAPGS